MNKILRSIIRRLFPLRTESAHVVIKTPSTRYSAKITDVEVDYENYGSNLPARERIVLHSDEHVHQTPRTDTNQ